MPASPMPATGYERAFYTIVADKTSAIGFPFILSFDPIFTGSAAASNRACVSAGAINGYRRGYHGNFPPRTN
jgi:predicted cobalt transporter CbtA